MTADTDDLTTAVAPTRPARRWRLLAFLVSLTVGCLVAGVVFLVRGSHVSGSGPMANRAVIDATTTHAVIGQVSDGLNQVLSYSYAHPEVAQQAAKTWLTGDAVAQYHLLFTQLNARAPGQKLTFVAKVVTAGVVTLHGDTAELLVFLDQRSTRASDNQSSVAAAQVQIQAVRHGSKWQISELHPL